MMSQELSDMNVVSSEAGSIEVGSEQDQIWEAPRLIELDKVSNTQKISWNTEHASASGLS